MPSGSRSAVGPVNDKRLAELIEPVVAAAGMDLESVRMSVAGKRRLLRIVVDGDHGVSLDDAADVSREISAMLDEANALGEVPYTLEVSSPGVDRPLTEPQALAARGRPAGQGEGDRRGNDGGPDTGGGCRRRHARPAQGRAPVRAGGAGRGRHPDRVRADSGRRTRPGRR